MTLEKAKRKMLSEHFSLYEMMRSETAENHNIGNMPDATTDKTNTLGFGKSYIGFANKLTSKRLLAGYQYVRCTFCKNKVSSKRQTVFPFRYRNANFTS